MPIKKKQPKKPNAKTHGKKKTNGAGRPVIICTDKRGVFFGYAKDTSGDPVVLTQARMAVYWSADCHGLPGLAATGPTSGCRISPPMPAVELRGVHAVIEVSSDATAAWERATWSK